MIGRLLRLALVLGLVAAMVAGPSVGTAGARGGQSNPTAPPTTPDGNAAIDDLVGCVQGSHRLLVLFLFDESTSLQKNDPEARRVAAARSALDSLVALATGEGDAAPDVRVALAAFSNDYRPVEDWTAVDGSSAEGLRRSLDSFADLNTGTDTDFVHALSAAQQSLADQAAVVTEQAAVVTEQGGEPPCKAILLFTDGAYDVGVRETQAQRDELGLTKDYAPGIELTSPEAVREVKAAGRKALCEPGGVADRLRGDDITLLTVALAGNVRRSVQRTLAAVTAGKADDVTCGTPSSRPNGAYLPADQADVLVARFNEVGARLAGGNLLPGDDQVQVCGAAGCDEGTRRFTLDQSLRRAQVLALPAKPGARVVLEGPGGTAEIDQAGSSTVGSVPISARAIAGRGLAIDLTRPDAAGDWDGEWQVSIVDDAQAGDPATLQVFVFSDLGVRLSGSVPLQRGAKTDVQAELVVPDGVDAANVVASAEAELRLTNPIDGSLQAVPLSGPPTGPYTGTVDLPDDTTTNALQAVVEVRITTTGGAALVTQSPAAEMLVRRPAASAQYVPASLELPSLTGTGTTETELVITGGSEDRCVWFGDTEVPDAPEGAGTITVARPDQALPGAGDCLKVPAGQRTSLTLQASASGRASGTVRGWVTVYEGPDGASPATTTQIPFRFDMARGVDQARRLLLTVVLLVAGLAIPMVVLLVVNAATARFQSLDVVQGAALPIRVRGGKIFRTDADQPRSLSLRPADFSPMDEAGDARRFCFGGVEFRAQASRNPFGGTVAMAAPEGGAERLKGHAGSKVELDPSLAGSWVFLLDADKTRLAGPDEEVGQLLAFVGAGDPARQAAAMVPDITERLPATAARLAGLLREVKPAPSRRRRRHDDEDHAAEEVEVTEASDAAAAEANGGSSTEAEPPAPDAEAPPAEPPAPEPPADGAAPSSGPDRPPPESPTGGPLGFTGGPSA